MAIAKLKFQTLRESEYPILRKVNLMDWLIEKMRLAAPNLSDLKKTREGLAEYYVKFSNITIDRSLRDGEIKYNVSIDYNDINVVGYKEEKWYHEDTMEKIKTRIINGFNTWLEKYKDTHPDRDASSQSLMKSHPIIILMHPDYISGKDSSKIPIYFLIDNCILPIFDYNDGYFDTYTYDEYKEYINDVPNYTDSPMEGFTSLPSFLIHRLYMPGAKGTIPDVSIRDGNVYNYNTVSMMSTLQVFNKDAYYNDFIKYLNKIGYPYKEFIISDDSFFDKDTPIIALSFNYPPERLLGENDFRGINKLSIYDNNEWVLLEFFGLFPPAEWLTRYHEIQYFIPIVFSNKFPPYEE